MHRYSDINYIMSMPIQRGLNLIITAYKKDTEEKLWQRWNIEHVFMEEFMSFEDFKKKALGNIESVNHGEVDVKKILSKAEKIKRADQKQWKGGKQ